MGALNGNAKTDRLRAVGADDSSAIAGQSLLLIGTGRSLKALAAQLASLERPPKSVACVLAWEAAGAGDGAPATARENARNGAERMGTGNGGASGGAMGGVGGAGGESMPAGLPLLGGLPDLWRILAQRKPDLALISLPAHMTEPLAQAMRTLRSRRVPARFVPTLSDMLRTMGESRTAPAAAPLTGPAASADSLWRPPARIDLARLIGREPRAIDADSVGAVIRGRRVLITGAGGSIGSELARVAAAFHPEQLILLDRSENALFEIDRRLAERFAAVPRRAILHDVADEQATRRLVAEARPHIVFHAAAHKHVPLMEDHPAHAITNNVFGSRSIADAAVEAGAERFVMISSDKAVNPTSVMGATKRLAEVYVRDLARRSAESGATNLSMVRFGNVLGSACSVLTIWSAQIADGGPLTITDPRMTRYFMTIPEAAALVVQSAALRVDRLSEPGLRAHQRSEAGRSGAAPVFVLDMGEPVRIVDLAARFIRAHGLRPRFLVTDEAEAREPGLSALLVALRADLAQTGAGDAAEPIDVIFTGARPGEKLHEQLAYDAEAGHLHPTSVPGILAFTGDAADDFNVEAMLAHLDEARATSGRGQALEALRRHVPTLRRAIPVTMPRERLIA